MEIKILKGVAAFSFAILSSLLVSVEALKRHGFKFTSYEER
jgi:hypothetical protein